MTKQQAVWLVYCMAEALNTPEMKGIMERYYGTKGVEGAWQGCVDLAKQFDFELPVLSK